MDPQRFFGTTPWVRRLIVANLLVFLLQKTVIVDPRFQAYLAFDPLIGLARPWTFVTYLFLHGGVLHLAFNMLALFLFGPPVEERMGGGPFLLYYLACGLGGAALSLGLMMLMPPAPIVGASAAIFGVMLAFAWEWPDQPVYVLFLPEPVPAKWLVTFAVAISLALIAFGANDGVAHLAHLGGFATGFLWLKAQDLRLARAERQLRQASGPTVLVHPAAMVARGAEPPAKRSRPVRDPTFVEIDRVLDKISASGMASLTPSERRFLTEMSRKMRGG
ncbi:MAG TPA: rhomboid family intramembrane serine protease [Gemmatimonadales bacterium]|nr:rhomboid family intramembrane serine protease [Gemmatimonadales bacterium]